MRDTLLIQQAQAAHIHLLNLTIRDHSSYCERHDFDYWPVYGGALTKADGDRHAYWDKLKLILRGVEAGYERVIWLDSDCYIADPDVDLREACPVDGLGMVWHGKGHWPEHPDCFDHFNAGCIYAGIGVDASRLLRLWWRSPDDNHFWHDQAALNLHAIPDFARLYRKEAPVTTLGYEWNAVPFEPFTHDRPIVAAWHGYEFDIERRHAAMQAFIQDNTLRRMLAGCSAEEACQKADYCAGIGNHAGADTFFARAEELGATGDAFYGQWGRSLAKWNRHAEAEAKFRKSLEMEPGNGPVWQLLGMCYDYLGEHEKNGESIRRAKEYSPNWAPLMHNESLWQLRNGDWREGFAGMEWQFLTRERIARHPSAQWDGQPCDELLVWAEQGLGDTLMLSRFMPAIAQSSNVTLEVQKPLASFLEAQCWPNVIVVPRPDNDSLLWPFFQHVGMFSLPALAGATVENTVGTPYLKAPAQKVEQWRDAFFRNDFALYGPDFNCQNRMRIGFSWAGSAAHGNNHNRNMTAGHFDELVKTPGTRWYSLQRDLVIPDEIKESTPEVTWIGDDFEDMADTAGVLMNLDLVITIDSAIAHLAGALGVRCWVLLSKSSDWRWLLDRTTTPWYDSVTLYRQSTLGDWDSVVADVERDLKELIENG